MAVNIRWGPFETELKAIPINSRYGQYMPWEIGEQVYNLSGFDPTLCDHAISPEEVRRIHTLLQKNKYFKADHIPLTCWSIPIVIIVLIMVISYLNRERPLSSARKFSILFALALLLILPVILMVIAKNSSANRDGRRVDELKKALKSIQSTVLAGRNIDLRISSLGSYLIIDTSKISVPLPSTRGITSARYPYSAAAGTPKASGHYTNPRIQVNQSVEDSVKVTMPVDILADKA